MAEKKINVKIGADTSALKTGIAEAKGAINDLAKSVGGIESAFASISGLAVLAGPIEAVKGWAAAVNDLEDKTNMAGEAASQLLAIGQHVGLSTEDMSSAIMKMTKNAYASAEAIGSNSDVFSKWGIQITDTNGGLLSAEQILKNVAAVHREMANGVAKNAMEMEIFGRSGGKLNDILNLTEEQMAEVAQHAQDVGLIMSHDVTQAFEDTQFQVNDAKMALQGMAVAIGAEMLPEVQKLCDWLKNMSAELANTDDGTKRNIAVFGEAVGVIGALTIAIQGASLAYNALYGAAMKAAAAVKAIGSLGSAALTAGAALAYGAYEKYQYAEAGGQFSYEDDSDIITMGPKETLKGRPVLSASEKAELAAVNTTPIIPTPKGGASGGGSGSSGIDNTQREINRITEKLEAAIIKTGDLQHEFDNLQIRTNFETLTGGDSVYGRIKQTEQQRIESIDNILQKQAKAIDEAEKLRASAESTGDDAAIARANELCEQRKALYEQSAIEAAEMEKQVHQAAQNEMLQIDTEINALRADMQEAQNNADLEQYLAFLESKKAARLLDLQSEMEERQMLWAWMQEANTSMMEMEMQTAEQFKNNLAGGIASCITGAKSLSDAFKDALKAAINMFVQLIVKQTMARAMGKMFAHQQNAEAAASGSAQAAALAPAAIQKSIAIAGPIAGPALYGAATGSMSAMAASLSAFSNLGAAFQFASGGIVTGPTLGMIGEAGDKEMVLPLNEDSLERVGFAGMGQPNYTINVSAIDADGVASFFQRNGASIVDALTNQARKFNYGGAY